MSFHDEKGNQKNFYLFLDEALSTIIIIILLLVSLSQQCLLVGFHWNLSDRKSPQVSWILLSILADLNDAVVWTVLILPLIFNCSNPLCNLLGIISTAPTTIDITITCIFQGPSIWLSFHFLYFHSAVCWNSKIH